MSKKEVETGAISPEVKKYDYSAFNEHFREIETPEEMIPYLEEMRTEYIELSLYTEQITAGVNGIAHQSHEKALDHSHMLRDVIELFKSLKTSKS